MLLSHQTGGRMLPVAGAPQPLRPLLVARRAAPCMVTAAASNGNGSLPMPNGQTIIGPSGPELTLTREPEPMSAEVAAIVQEQGLDWETSGLKYLTNEARLRALDKKATKVEKTKNKKGGDRMWTEVKELGELVRAGQTKWEDLDLDDIDVRLKWSGLFHRRKRAPGTFMMRLKVPNGELTSAQLRFFDDTLKQLGEGACADITTRANIQLRGITLAEADKIMEGLCEHGLSSVMSGMDNVRNMTGSPIAGLDPHELLDTRPLNKEINDMITNFGNGNPALANLPRKLNIGLSPSRDDFPHTHINDIGLKAVKDPATGEVGFNVELGGYFSIKRNAVAISGDTFLKLDQVTDYCRAALEVFRDHGARNDRQKGRLLWLVEMWGADKFRDMVSELMGVTLAKGVEEKYDDVWERRDLLGVHKQKQPGLNWVGAGVTVGRLFADDFSAFADVCDKYGDGTVRVTVEQDIIFPNIPDEKVDALSAEPIFEKFRINPTPLTRRLVSCTGAEFCGVAIIETKNRAMAVISKLESELDFPRPIRMHWTGCPNSCAQAQVADIGLMGGPAKLDGKAVEGVRIFVGGTIGENAVLGEELEKGVPCEESILLPKLKDLLINQFGATPKAGVMATA